MRWCYSLSNFLCKQEEKKNCKKCGANQTSGPQGQVCATGMYRSIEHVEFPEFQTGIVIEWKAPQ